MDRQQISKAVNALLKHELKALDEDAEKDKTMWLVFTVKKMAEKQRVKPVAITLPHSYLEEAEICLICKDPQREYKDIVEGQDALKAIKKVIGVSKLREKYKPFEAKRTLCSSYDLFLADERVIEMLPKMLGKTFFLKKK